MERSLPNHEQLFEAGFEAFRTGDLAACVRHLQAALALSPDDTETLRTLGMAYYRLGEYQPALLLGERLVQVAPSDALSFTTLSLFLQKNGRIKEAEDASAKAKLLTWKKQLKEGSGTDARLNILDTNPLPPTSPPMMPTMPKRREPT